MATTMYNYQYEFTESSLGRVEKNAMPIESWRAGLDGEISSDEQYWPEMRECWEIRKELDYDPAFVKWMDENIIGPQP